MKKIKEYDITLNKLKSLKMKILEKFQKVFCSDYYEENIFINKKQIKDMKWLLKIYNWILGYIRYMQ